ncbi:MAG: tRNA (adenosine(37)-N6)-dimethylallyltransferase MiaA [Clostridia bacterium]|nr:tRNA (adenosine(37)-N6)-dimethylallyltransferase MiaA [Clostridia bacterium]
MWKAVTEEGRAKFPVAALVGPTAVGKSRIAVEVASRLNGEILSADSVQVYKGMDIGSNKTMPEDQVASSGKAIPHHLIDICMPNDSFNVKEYQVRATKLIPEVVQRGALPILVGGTGLYVKAVLGGYHLPPIGDVSQIRESLAAELSKNGSVPLWNRLRHVDPESAERIHPNDARRIIRALEVYIKTGIPFSELRKTQEALPYATCKVGVTLDRDEIYRRINTRVIKMVEQGFVEEVANLLKTYGSDLPALQSLGYRQLTAYLSGEKDLATAIREIQRDTRHYAKRQLTWFKRDPEIVWFKLEKRYDPLRAAEQISDFIVHRLRVHIAGGKKNGQRLD